MSNWRDEVAEVLEVVALDGLPEPRDLDVALDAIASAVSDEIEKLREAALDALAGLVAAHSLLKRGGKKAAPSDKMFEQMLCDYGATITRVRAALGEKK